MSRWQDDATRVIPAHLEYITVYNPSLGTTDETRHDQILCFCSPKGPRKPRRDKTGSTSALRNENGDADVNEQLRQVGLAQGMVAFAGLDDVNSRTSRDRFRKMLDDFWTHFAENWDVLLHGNPIVDSYDGIKLAGGGELGVGVGEEDWGSGERAMLEGIIAGIDGLVDVVVSKYGESGSSFDNSGSDQSPRSWLGGMVHPGSDDGVLFRGIGALSSPTTRCIVDWMESIHFHGDDAYGLRDRSASRRHKRTERGTQIVEKMQQDPSTLEDSNGIENRTEELHLESPKASPVQVESADPKIPRPIVSVAEDALRETTASIDAHGGLQTDTKETISSPQMDTPIPWSKYLTLGYGSAWGSSSKKDVASNASPGPIAEDPKSISGQKSHKSQSSKIAQTPSASEKPHRTSSAGRFMIGLNGDLDASKEGLEQAPDDIPSMPENRVSFRTVYTPSVEAEGLANSTTASEDLSEHSSFGSQNGRNAHQDSTQQYSSRRFRVVVYAVSKPKPLHPRVLISSASTFHLYIPLRAFSFITSHAVLLQNASQASRSTLQVNAWNPITRACSTQAECRYAAPNFCHIGVLSV
ncbi:MAG: hypothetical protein M1828_007308 [Chrysothrix sp. TS-e1954]|nr:MAG: hypothetical protein M1828_007308 [Chrysothrix sp. TS-e1954]